jgi:Derlin-2/3
MAAVANQPNMLTEITNFLNSIPVVTRYLSVSTICFSLGAELGLISVKQISLFLPYVLQRFQVWRLVTNHLYTSGMGLIWHCFMLYQNSRTLEVSHFATRPGDYAYCVTLIMVQRANLDGS